MARTTQLTEDQVRELEEGVRRLAAEGNPLAVDIQRRLAACETPLEKAAILAQLDDDLRQAESAIKTMMQGFAATGVPPKCRTTAGSRVLTTCGRLPTRKGDQTHATSAPRVQPGV